MVVCNIISLDFHIHLTDLQRESERTEFSLQNDSFVINFSRFNPVHMNEDNSGIFKIC